MDNYDTGIDVCLIHPLELTAHDWEEIRAIAQEYLERGETNFAKAYVSAYVDWLRLDVIEGKKH